jgi:hypothetical protein
LDNSGGHKWKQTYAYIIKVWNTGYGAVLGRFSGVMNLFFTVATFFLVKGMDLSYTQTIILGIVVISTIMIAGFIYLKLGLQKAEFSSNFDEAPEWKDIRDRIIRIDNMLTEEQKNKVKING